jgi:hypothetical protein
MLTNKIASWQDLSTVHVSIERIPNGMFRWEIKNTAGEVLATEREETISSALEFAGFAMKEIMEDMADHVLHPEWFDGSMDDDVDVVFTTIDGGN